jgi:hypothetical protein
MHTYIHVYIYFTSKSLCETTKERAKTLTSVVHHGLFQSALGLEREGGGEVREGKKGGGKGAENEEGRRKEREKE